MIKVFFHRKDGRINKFYGEGHAEAGEYGEDVVCAAVSMSLQQTAVGILKYLKLKPEMNMKDGFLSIDLKQTDLNCRELELDAILETMFIMMQEMEKQYPDYVKVVEKEV
jgi:hypothetical protein